MLISQFHSQWLVPIWLAAPGINKVEWQWSWSIMFFVITGFIFFKSKERKDNRELKGEIHVQDLMKRKAMLEEEIAEMEIECEQGNLSEEVFRKRKAELEKYLARTNTELKHYIA